MASDPLGSVAIQKK